MNEETVVYPGSGLLHTGSVFRYWGALGYRTPKALWLSWTWIPEQSHALRRCMSHQESAKL